MAGVTEVASVSIGTVTVTLHISTYGSAIQWTLDSEHSVTVLSYLYINVTCKENQIAQCFSDA